MAENSRKLIKYGYIAAGVSLLIFPAPLAIVGIIIGSINMKRGYIKHGIAQILLAIACGVIGTYLGAFLYNRFI